MDTIYYPCSHCLKSLSSISGVIITVPMIARKRFFSGSHAKQINNKIIRISPGCGCYNLYIIFQKTF